ncbi:hypothetical protein FHU39_003910 [Flexivirga oryzae]|uniref:DUF1877 family protein n=2 Tax=Flexivirga oryzae TaxID=1794944 RepID=A0A839ND40_9MICO|nr:hypothetical protein [Flexivirga oryzae]
MGRRVDSATAAGVLADPGRLDDLLWLDDGRVLDLDKAWGGVHWLLTGDVGPTGGALSEAIMGGEPFGDDRGYGPASLLDAGGTAATAHALRQVGNDTLRDRFDPAAMEEAGIYPSIWDEDDVLDEYLLPKVDLLRAFYDAAAGAGESVIQVMS